MQLYSHLFYTALIVMVILSDEFDSCMRWKVFFPFSLSLCVSHEAHWQPVRGAHRLSPLDSQDKLQPPTTLLSGKKNKQTYALSIEDTQTGTFQRFLTGPLTYFKTL